MRPTFYSNNLWFNQLNIVLNIIYKIHSYFVMLNAEFSAFWCLLNLKLICRWLNVLFSGFRIGDDMLNLLALRYGTSSMCLTMESFITMVIRMESMSSECIQNICRENSEKKKTSQKLWFCLQEENNYVVPNRNL